MASLPRIGAEGTVDARENWQAAQAYLYHELDVVLELVMMGNCIPQTLLQQSAVW